MPDSLPDGLPGSHILSRCKVGWKCNYTLESNDLDQVVNNTGIDVL